MVDEFNIQEKEIWKILETVMDPELPVLSITDLGMVRKVEIYNTVQKPPLGGLGIFITSTYTGCPAVDVISMNIRMALLEHGFSNVDVIQVLSPAWTTEWMNEAAKQKLKAYGIAPPNTMQQVNAADLFQEEETIQCPQCNSFNTKLLSRFGSAACKALYTCNDCMETFDYFKCH